MKRFLTVATLRAILGFASEDPLLARGASPRELYGPNPWERTTGIWGQDKKSLIDHGIGINSSFTADMLGNPVGGHAQGFAYAGSLGLGLNIDFGKACGLTGFEFYSSVVWRTGTNLSQRKIKNQFTVAEVYGSQTVKLNELYIRQTLFDKSLLFKLGRLNAGNDFLTSPLYAHFVNNAFDGNPVSVFYNVPFTAYPNATWGAYVQYMPSSWLLMKFACYNANSYINQNKFHGVNFTFNSTNGVIWITEWCLLVNQRADSNGLPGNYKVGFFYQTGDARKFLGGKEKGDPCLYFLLDQTIYRPKKGEKNTGLTPFTAVILMPNNRNTMPFFLLGGFVFRGVIPSRPDDGPSLGFAYGKYSTDLSQLQRISKRMGLIGPHGSQPQNFEALIELCYWIQATSWLSFVPDLQYIIHPSGRNIPNAWVVGVQINIDLL